MFVGGQKEMLTVLSQLGIPKAQAGNWGDIARIDLNPQSLEVIVCSWATDSFMLGKRDS